jgi:hypothetical protein
MPEASEDFLFTGGQSGDTATTLSQEQVESLRATNSHKLTNNSLAVRTLSLYQYAVHRLEFLLLEVLNLFLILRNVILSVSPPSISLIWFRTRIIGNNMKVCIYRVSQEECARLRESVP